MVEAILSEHPCRPRHTFEVDGLQCRCLWACSSAQTTLSSPCPTKGKYEPLEPSSLIHELPGLGPLLTSASLGSSCG